MNTQLSKYLMMSVGEIDSEIEKQKKKKEEASNMISALLELKKLKESASSASEFDMSESSSFKDESSSWDSSMTTY